MSPGVEWCFCCDYQCWSALLCGQNNSTPRVWPGRTCSRDKNPLSIIDLRGAFTDRGFFNWCVVHRLCISWCTFVQHSWEHTYSESAAAKMRNETSKLAIFRCVNNILYWPSGKSSYTHHACILHESVWWYSQSPLPRPSICTYQWVWYQQLPADKHCNTIVSLHVSKFVLARYVRTCIASEDGTTSIYTSLRPRLGKLRSSKCSFFA